MTNPGFRKGRKMQDVSFKSIEEFLEYLSGEELEMVQKLRSLIFQAIPDVHEKLSYNVPFYKRNAGICFIWPPSIPWGSKTYPFVRLGFSKGYLIEDEEGYLEKGDRKQVYTRDFRRLEEIDDDLVLTYLTKALIVDEG